MTIRIVTSHPALQYVLQRTAPVGMNVRCVGLGRRKTSSATYAIMVEQAPLPFRAEGGLAAWLPPHLRHYGVKRCEIDGRAVPTGEAELCRALSLSQARPTLRRVRASRRFPLRAWAS